VRCTVEEDGGTAPIRPRHVAIPFRRFRNFGVDITRAYVRAFEGRRIPHVLVGGRSFHDREENHRPSQRAEGHLDRTLCLPFSHCQQLQSLAWIGEKFEEVPKSPNPRHFSTRRGTPAGRTAYYQASGNARVPVCPVFAVIHFDLVGDHADFEI
jgi:hypothetical protein